MSSRPATPPEHPGLVVKSLQTGKESVIQPPGTVAPVAAEKPIVRPDLGELTSYAKSVVGPHVRSVSLVGSVAANGAGHDVDLLYDLGDDLVLPPGDAEEALERYLEGTKIDLERADSFFKVGDRYFHLATGAGNAIIENTNYAAEQAGKPVKVLAEAPPAAAPPPEWMGAAA